MSEIKDKYLYPFIAPNHTGFLEVGNNHQIYWEECGNPKGFPVLVIHGGPGAGCDEDNRRFFDPAKWRVILHDQRGSGRSKPFGKLHANNTWALVDDIRTLCKELGIDKFVIWGGSWGSTLALVYAITYPRTVAGMVLRGIFLGEKDEVDYLYTGNVALYRPKAWKRFASQVPEKDRKNILAYYHQQLTSSDPEIRRRFAYEMSFFEMSLLQLEDKSSDEIGQETEDFSFESMALMEAHYFVNNCFLDEGYIISNAKDIKNIPTTIIQGDYDLVCPPISAHRLHEALPRSTLHRTLAGHSSNDPENIKMLVSETNIMFDLVSS